MRDSRAVGMHHRASSCVNFWWIIHPVRHCERQWTLSPRAVTCGMAHAHLKRKKAAQYDLTGDTVGPLSQLYSYLYNYLRGELGGVISGAALNICTRARRW